MEAQSDAPTPETLTPDRRKAILAGRIQTLVGNGHRVESQSDYQVILVEGKRPNHLLHFFISILTIGLWVFVWIGLAVFGGERRTVVSVDEYGRLVESR